MSYYTYSLVNDFGGNLNSSQLHQEIADSISISQNILRVDTIGDVVKIVFEDALSAGEQTILSSLVSTHVAIVEDEYSKLIKLVPRDKKINNTSYSREDTFVYDGTNNIEEIKKITLVSNMDVGVSNYSVKIFDTTNVLPIIEETFTNTVESIIDITNITNLPTEKAIFELLVKKEGGNVTKYAHIDSITIYI